MATKNSARVMETRESGEIRVDYYVRSVGKDAKLFDDGAAEQDGWAAYREEPVFVTVGIERRQYTLVERVSYAPRATIEDALTDMWVAIKLHTEPEGEARGRLVKRGA
jgi:hypothetical protein